MLSERPSATGRHLLYCTPVLFDSTNTLFSGSVYLLGYQRRSAIAGSEAVRLRLQFGQDLQASYFQNFKNFLLIFNFLLDMTFTGMLKSRLATTGSKLAPKRRLRP